MACHAMMCYATPCCAMPSCVMAWCAVLCHGMPCHAMLCYATLCHAMPRYATLCHAMPRYATLCHAMLPFPTLNLMHVPSSISCPRSMLCHSLELLAAYLQVTSAKAKLEKSVSGDAFPLDYSTSMRVIRDALHGVLPPPLVVSEGANTMDNARSALNPPGCPPLLPYCHPLQYWCTAQPSNPHPPFSPLCTSQLDFRLRPKGILA